MYVRKRQGRETKENGVENSKEDAGINSMQKVMSVAIEITG